MTGRDSFEVTQEQRTGLERLAGSSNRADTDRARAIVLTLAKLEICLTITGYVSIRPLRRFANPRASAAIIDILEPDNIVFAQVRTGLHLDQFELDPAGIGHSMHATYRQIDRTRSRAQDGPQCPG